MNSRERGIIGAMSTQQSIVFRQHLRPEHVGEYVLLPFEVPAGAARIDIRYSYDRAVPPVPGAPPGNAIDLGLFDPRGAAFGSARGFRGWSGTARQEVFVAPDDATPGYLPGPIYPGVWHVLLGLYHIHPSGCDYELSIHLTPGPAPEPTPISWPAPTILKETRWYRGDLHCHSHHSEATGSLEELCAAAVRVGLDFLAVTEHNTISHHRLLGQYRTATFLPIPGEEVTSYLGHANVWGAEGWIDFRCQRDADMARVIRMAHDAGGLVSANHPKTNGPPWEFSTFAGIDCLEVWQGPWFLSNYQSLAIWDELLRKGRRVVGVGGSDEHQPASGESGAWQRLGQPTTWVYATALEQSAILEAIKAGHVAISAGPQGPLLECWGEAGGKTAMMGDSLPITSGETVRITGRVCGAAGLNLRLVGPKGLMALIPIDSDDFAFEHRLASHVSTYVRTEVAEPLAPEDVNEPAALMVKALGNPIYITIA